MSGSAQTAHSPPKWFIRKPINILAHAQLLGFAASEGLRAGGPSGSWSCSWALEVGAQQIQRQRRRLRERNGSGNWCRNELGGESSAFEQRRRASGGGGHGGVGHGGEGCSSAAVIETWGCPNCLIKVPGTSLRLQICRDFYWSQRLTPYER